MNRKAVTGRSIPWLPKSHSASLPHGPGICSPGRCRRIAFACVAPVPLPQSEAKWLALSEANWPCGLLTLCGGLALRRLCSLHLGACPDKVRVGAGYSPASPRLSIASFAYARTPFRRMLAVTRLATSSSCHSEARRTGPKNLCGRITAHPPTRTP
jgi:hypothetical protein